MSARPRRLFATLLIGVGPLNPLAVGIIVFGQTIVAGSACQGTSEPDPDAPDCGDLENEERCG